MIRKILVPTDGSPSSQAAVHAAVALARTVNAALVFFHAFPPFHGGAYGTADTARRQLAEAYEAGAKGVAAGILEPAMELARAAGVRSEAHVAESERPWEAIIAAAKRTRSDAICMGSHGRRGLAGVVLGSETARVLTHCTLPVLVIR